MVAHNEMSRLVEDREPNELCAIIRRHRMHYDVAPELHFEADGSKRRIGFQLRLCGAHARGSRPQPGCTASRAIHRDLERVADFAIADSGGALKWVRIPFSPALYWAPAERLDEVALLLTGFADDYARGALAETEAALRDVRRRLESVGVCEGRWRDGSGERLPSEMVAERSTLLPMPRQ
jgi:hypothetical protein